MILLLKRLVVFTLGFAFLFLALSALFEVRVRQRDNYFMHLSDFAHPDNRPEVLFLGDSVPAFAIHRSRHSPRYYNFAAPGENLREVYLKLIYALRTKPSIRYVVLQVDDHVLSAYRADANRFTDAVFFSRFEDFREVYEVGRLGYLKRLLALSIPLLESRQRWTLRVVLSKDIDAWWRGTKATRGRYLDNCYDFRRREETPWTRRSATRRRDWVTEIVSGQLGRTTFHPDLVAVLNKILAVARTYGVTVIGVRYPLTNEYKIQAKAYDRGKVRALFNSIQLGALLDYQNLFDARQDLFNDPNHLYPTGAREFTVRLIADLERLIGEDPQTGQQCVVRAERSDWGSIALYRPLFERFQ